MPNIPALAHWLLIAMGSFYPQESHRFVDEDKNITEERYEEIAYDIAFAVSQPYVRPAFDDKDPIAARAKTGLLLVSIGADESRYIEDVETLFASGRDFIVESEPHAADGHPDELHSDIRIIGLGDAPMFTVRSEQ